MVPGDSKESSLELSMGAAPSDALEDLPTATEDMHLLVGAGAVQSGLRSPHLKEMFEYYQSLRAEGETMPPRSRFNPADIPRHLSNIFLVEVEQQPDGSRDFRYRVFGTGLAILFGTEMTGKLISEFPGQNRAERSRRIMDQVVSLKRPVRTAGNFVSKNGMPIFGESIVMPFGEDGQVTHLLADLDYDQSR